MARSRAITLAVASAAAIFLLAGCNSSSSSTTGGTAATASTAAASAAAASNSASASTSAAAVAFVPITEVFDPGHPARAVSSPASCGDQNSTLAIEQCFENKTESADAAIDTAQRASFASASAAQQVALNTGDRGWLAARQVVCAKAFHTGGTIDGINVGGCLLDESTARLDAVKGVTPPEAVLKSTDSDSLSELSWYTTPAGSRIAMIDTQGDASGGVVISWVIIGGADGFVVNPAQFPYRARSFTDAGIVQGASPSGHRVATGTVYQFSVDYSHLSSAPSGGKNGGWVYAPGAAVAVWR